MFEAAIMLVAAATASGAPTCWAAARMLPQGAPVGRGDAKPGPCGDRAMPLLRFDRRAGVARARVTITPGTPLGRVWLAEAPSVRTGDPVSLFARIGPVTLVRNVVAVQPARAGERFFVRDEDGGIFAAPPLVGPKEASAWTRQ